jgi:limonene-1,2-epoxide hydrolase
VFEMQDGRIKLRRDYLDLAAYTPTMAPAK